MAALECMLCLIPGANWKSLLKGAFDAQLFDPTVV